MKRIFTLVGVLYTLNVMSSFAAGGPDAYGYTWKDSNDPGGPVYNWIDISGIGTSVVGLADDNSCATLTPIGFNFHYYWSDFNKVKIGSNGWLSFDSPSNIASCFPAIPTAGGSADNILAAFMTDLTFLGVGNVAQCHYWSNFTDTFIVQYSNVPYWQAGSPGYTGLNNFQIILSGIDSSITFQYQTVSPVIDLGACVDFTVGIENLTGSIGLSVYQDIMPPTNYAIKFDYPTTVLVAVQDATPFWNQNVGSRGAIVGAGSFPLLAKIQNVGNANITTPTNVSAQIRDLAFTLVFSDADTIPSLIAGGQSILNFNNPSLLTAGSYSYQVSTNNVNDINPTNNQRLSEIVVVNACASTALTYHSANAPDQIVSWNSGIGGDDGIGVFYKPPVYPIVINSLEYYIMNATTDGFSAAIYANDAPFGAPGTLLSTTAVPFGSVIVGDWNVVNLGTPVTIDSAGFYVVWFQDGPTISLGLETAFPFSRNNYEILDGQWSEYRMNEDQDAAVRVNIVPPGLNNATTLAGVTITATQAGGTYQWLDCNSAFAVVAGATGQSFTPLVNGNYAAQINFAGCVDTSACTLVNSIGIEEVVLNNAVVFPNPANSFVNIQLLNTDDATNLSLTITDIAGKAILASYQISNDLIRLNLDGMSDGIYTYRISENGKLISVGKFVKQ